MNKLNRDDSISVLDTINQLRAERDALAAQVEIMRSALELAFISVRTCYKQDWAPFKDFTTVEKAIKLAPSHCLSEIRAEAGRAGYIRGGKDQAISPESWQVRVTRAEEYYKEILQGGAA